MRFRSSSTDHLHHTSDWTELNSNWCLMLIVPVSRLLFSLSHEITTANPTSTIFPISETLTCFRRWIYHQFRYQQWSHLLGAWILKGWPRHRRKNKGGMGCVSEMMIESWSCSQVDSEIKMAHLEWHGGRKNLRNRSRVDRYTIHGSSWWCLGRRWKRRGWEEESERDWDVEKVSRLMAWEDCMILMNSWSELKLRVFLQRGRAAADCHVVFFSSNSAPFSPTWIEDSLVVKFEGDSSQRRTVLGDVEKDVGHDFSCGIESTCERWSEGHVVEGVETKSRERERDWKS